MSRDMPRTFRHDEAGFSLPELIMVVMLMSIIGVMLFTSMATFTRSTASTDAKTLTLSDTRTALETIARDLRAANPIDAISPTTRYDTEVGFSVFCSSPGANGCLSTNLRPVVYRVAGHTLERVVGGSTRPLVGPEGAPTLPGQLRRGAVVNSSTEPIFTYLDRDGVRLATSGVGAPPSTSFRDCAKTVRIHLKVRSAHNNPDAIVNMITTVALRNYNEVNGC